MHKILAVIKPNPTEANLLRGAGKLVHSDATRGYVRGRAKHVLRLGRPAHGSIVSWTAVSARDDQRLTDQHPQLLQFRDERRRHAFGGQLPAMPAAKFVLVEMCAQLFAHCLITPRRPLIIPQSPERFLQ